MIRKPAFLNRASRWNLVRTLQQKRSPAALVYGGRQKGNYPLEIAWLQRADQGGRVAILSGFQSHPTSIISGWRAKYSFTSIGPSAVSMVCTSIQRSPGNVSGERF